jgi:flagellar hook protein FlgE
MSISSSMNAGISGLQANSNRLASISDNIANSETIGYRRSQTAFHSMVVGSGIAGQGSFAAGGVRTSTLRLVDQGGSLVGTQNATDIALSGRGFLPVTTELGARLTDGTAPLLLSATGSSARTQPVFCATRRAMRCWVGPSRRTGPCPFIRATM